MDSLNPGKGWALGYHRIEGVPITTYLISLTLLLIAISYFWWNIRKEKTTRKSELSILKELTGFKKPFKKP